MDANRSLLMSACEAEAYPKDLVYENDEHRPMLWLHLHQWVFIVAFKLLRDKGDSSRGRADVAEALSQIISGTAAIKVPNRQ